MPKEGKTREEFSGRFMESMEGFAEVHYQKCVSLYSAGKYEQAVSKCEELLDKRIGGPFLAIKGLSLVQLGRLDEALAVFDSLSKNYPNNPTVDNGKGLVFFYKGRFNEAADSLEKALKESPNEFGSLVLLSICYLAIGKNKDMEKYTQKAFNVDPVAAGEAYKKFLKAVISSGSLTKGKADEINGHITKIEEGLKALKGSKGKKK